MENQVNNQKLIEALEKVGEIFANLADDARDAAGFERDYADQAQVEEAPQGREVDEIDLDGLTPDSDVDVNIGDLWRLVNGARYMIRMAREGKVPNLDQRAPMERAIKALKADVPALRKGGIGRLIRG